MDPLFLIILIGGGTVIALFVLGIILTLMNKRRSARIVNILMYIFALITLILNIVYRSYSKASGTMIFANVLALFVVLISLKRHLKSAKNPQ